MALVFLVGPRASGKTTVGTILAQRMSVPFVDTDAELQVREGRSIQVLVASEGWSAFRRCESATLCAVLEALEAAGTGGVVSTGGGIVLAEENRRRLREHGTVIYLTAPAELLAARLAADPLASQRPSLTGKTPLEEVQDVLNQRHPLYVAAAHFCVEATEMPESIAERIMGILTQVKKSRNTL